MNRYVSANAAWRRRKSFSTLACTDTSSPEVGSSRMTRLGLSISDAREAHAPLLSAGQLVRIEVEMRVGQADRAQHRLDLALALGPRQRACGSASGSWSEPPDLPARVERRAGILVDVLEIAGHRRRSRRRRPPISRPAKRISPAVGPWMPITVLPSVDLPHPLSPTRPSVSPGHTASDTPSTARIEPDAPAEARSGPGSAARGPPSRAAARAEGSLTRALTGW